MSTALATQKRGLRLLRALGEGASSRVWLGELEEGGARVAIKLARTGSDKSHLADEAERLLHVDSPALAGLVDAGVTDREISAGRTIVTSGTPYLAVEWVDGSALDLGTPRSPAERLALALSVARDAGLALSDLHAAGAAHGDVKPDNLIVLAQPASQAKFGVRLVDLGLSGAADDVSPRGGTPRYLAPEVFAETPSGDGRARDLWALGLVLAEIVCPELRASGRPRELVSRMELPAELEPIVRALLQHAPGARPSAGWVRRRASEYLPADEPGNPAEHAKRAVRRAYLSLRRAEVLRAAESESSRIAVNGEPGRWLADAVALTRRVVALRGGAARSGNLELTGLDALGRSRWLVTLVGPTAAAWPLAPDLDDAELSRRLLAAAERADPSAWTLSDLSSGALGAAPAAADDPIELSLALGAGTSDPTTLYAAERLVLSGRAPPAVGLALGRSLRLAGELGRALAVLERVSTPLAEVEAAECARRAGDRDGARRMAEAASGLDAAGEARRLAILARLELDAGRPEQALRIVAHAADSAFALEVRALCELELGLPAATESVERARLVAASDEERARIEGVAGVLAHFSADAEAALAAFRRAAEHAARAFAVLEEATYQTGIAAAASNVGELGEALGAARRSALLFEHLGRPAEAARALLARAAVFAYAGAVAETRAAVDETLRCARAAGDQRCEAYAELALADVLDEPSGLEAASRAADLLRTANPDDRLQVGARLLRHRGSGIDLAAHDALASDPSVVADARLEWWGARAEREVEREAPERADLILAELCALAGAKASNPVRGRALAAGAKLAARISDGDVARRLALGASEVARELLRRAPAELKSAVSELAWISETRAPKEAGLLPEQMTDIEALVRSLGTRERLRPLLDQVLDALVLWTGVERGLLLLRAPGGRLVPRAARNLARADLGAEQLALSRSLAERALAQREPVVAVDAAGELPEVRSVHALKLRSVLAVPLIARAEALGVVYLDDRARRGAFGPRELAWVRLVAALASLAIADARDQILLRRAARRARRAEARVADQLARREAELDLAERELARTREARETRFPYDEIVGRSEPVRAMLRVVDRVTASEVPVLIVGESGSGKELVARAIHTNGPRSGRPFVTENCAAIPEGLLESALFGHVRGVSTGASRPRAGLFEVADRGTLFLDEIAEMSLGMQTKLLRVLEDGEVRPVGTERARRVDVRVIAATHRNLEERVKAGTFRQDLYYRLNVISITVPSLRDRPSDVPLLVRHFVSIHGHGRKLRVSKAALEALIAFAWPGNVRQLENEMRRALVLADEQIDVAELSPELQNGSGSGAGRRDGLNMRERVDALESELVRIALDRTAGNQTRAAEILGLSRFGLQKMMQRLRIADRPRALRRESRALRERS